MIVCGLVIWGQTAEDRQVNSMFMMEQNDKWIVALQKKYQSQTSSLKFNDYKLVTYNRKSKEKKKISIENYESLFPIEEGEIRVGEKWVLQCYLGSNIIYGINIENGQVKELVNKKRDDENVNAVKDFATYGDKIIYCYVNNGKSYIEIKDISSNEIISLGEYNTISDVYLSIYGNKAAYILDNQLYLYDINSKTTRKVDDKLYTGDIKIYKDNIYINEIEKDDEGYERYNVVKLNLDFNENIIITNFYFVTEFNIADQYIEFDKYFYDMDNEKLYVKIGSYQSVYCSKIIQDNFYESGKKLKALKENENYMEYPFKSGEEVLRDLSINDNKKAAMLSTGEILILSNDKEEENKRIKYYEAFNDISENNSYKSIYMYPCIYAIEFTEGKYELNCFNIETEKKYKITSIELSEDEEIIGLFNYDNKIALFIQGENNPRMYLYDIDNEELIELPLEIDEKITEFFFNDKVVIALSDKMNIFACGIRSGYILNKYISNKDDLYIWNITNQGIIIDDSSTFCMLDFNFNKIKTFADYEEMMTYYNKNK